MSLAIVIEPLGGLGNQLFVYATGRARAIDLQTELHADLRSFVDYEWHNYELDSFSSDLEVVETNMRLDLLRRRSHLSHRILRKANINRQWGTGAYVVEDSNLFDPRINMVPNGTRLRGYFQSYKYFERHAHQLKTEIKAVIQPSSWYLETLSMLDLIPGWSAVHVRRGNYIGLSSMGIAGNEYYARSLRLLRSNVGDGPIVVFSDDVAAAKELAPFNNDHDFLFIESPPGSRPLESLLLMSAGHHIITGNSSFSWWAAWLGDSDDRLVICPRPWLDDRSYNERDLLRPAWITVGRD